MIIDAHLHVNFKGFDAKNVISYLDRNKIDQCWLLTWEETEPAVPENYQHLSVEDTYAAYQQFPSRIIPMYAPDPKDPKLPSKIASWHQKGFKGCGELKVSMSWASTEMTVLLDCLANFGLPLIFHMEAAKTCFVPSPGHRFESFLAKLFSTSQWQGIPRGVANGIAAASRSLSAKKAAMSRLFPGYLHDYSNLVKRLEEYPNQIFIGHGPLFWKMISADWASNEIVYPRSPIKETGPIDHLLTKYTNMYADISGPSGYNALNRDRSFSQAFLEKHSGKILYGTDNFGPGLGALLRKLKLSPAAKNRIMGENAVGLVRPQNGTIP